MDTLIQKIISLVPTLLFLAIVVFGGLFGIIRGFRKSKIKALHKIIAFALSFLVYLVLCNSQTVDSLLFNLVNSLTNGIGNQFGVAITATTLKGALLEIVPTFIEDASISSAILSNPGYLYAIVNFVYHLVFSLVFLVVYWVFRFILFIIYCIFYSEKKYKKKLEEKAKEEKKEFVYNKRRLLGGLISLCFSFIVGIFTLSIFGNVFYVAAGTGENVLSEHKFADATVNNSYSIYNDIEDYGEYGIYKALNSVKTKSGVPIYLYASSFIFSGQIESTDESVSRNVCFTHEIGGFVDCAKQIVSLIEKEGCLDKLVDGTLTKNDFIELLKIDSFRSGVREVFGDLSKNSFFVIDYLFSIIDTYAENINDSGILPPDSPLSEIMNILFVKGYTSSSIPSEKNHVGEPLPYIKASYIVNKSDLLVAFDLLCEFIDLNIDLENPESVPDTKTIIEAVVPHLDNLTLLNRNNPYRNQINKVLNRLYSFVECSMLQADEENVIQNFDTNENIDWVKEVLGLVNVAGDGLKVYADIDNTGLDSFNLGSILALFEDQSFVDAYDNVVKYISENRIVSVALTAPLARSVFEKAISSFATGYEMPDELSFVNTYDKNGKLVSRGEIYNILNFVKNVASNQEICDFASGVNQEGVDVVSEVLLIKDQLFVNNDGGESIVDFITDSKLVRSIATAFLMNVKNKEENPTFIFPDEVLEKDSLGNVNKILTKQEFAYLFDFIKALPNDMVVKTDSMFDDIVSGAGNIFANKQIDSVVENSILFQANGAKYIIDYCNKEDQNILVLPNDLNNVYAWHNHNGECGEFVLLYNALKEMFVDSTDVDFEDVEGSIFNKFYDLNLAANYTSGATRLQVVYESDLIKATFSQFCWDMLDVLDVSTATVNSVKDYFGNVRLAELSALIDICKRLDLDIDNVDFDKVYELVSDLGALISPHPSGYFKGKSDLDILYSSKICTELLSKELDDKITSSDLCDINTLNKYKENGIYPKQELIALCDALAVNNLDDVVFESSNVSNSLLSAVTNLNRARDGSVIIPNSNVESRLDICYKSNIVKEIFSKFMLEKLDGYHNPIDKSLICDSDGIINKQEIKAIVKIANISNFQFTQDISALEKSLEEDFATFNDVLSSTEYGGEFAGLTKLDMIYDSVVATHYFTYTVDTQINASDCLDTHPDAYESNGNLKKSEIKILVDFLEGKNIDEFDIEDVTIDYILEHIFENKTSKSKILSSSLTLDFSKVSSIKMPYSAYSLYSVEHKVLTDIELYEILLFSKTLGINSIHNVKNTLNSLLLNLRLEDLPQYIELSDVITATVSFELFKSSTLIIPSWVVKNDSIGIQYINKSDLISFVDSLMMLGVDDVDHAKNISVSEFAIDNFNDTQYQKLSSCEIIRAVLTSHLDFGASIDEHVLINDVLVGDDIKDYLGNKIAIINSNEFINLLKGISAYNKKHSFTNIIEVNLNFDDLVDTDIDTLKILLNSNILRLTISKLFVDEGLFNISEVNNEMAVNLNTFSTVSVVSIAKDKILDRVS